MTKENNMTNVEMLREMIQMQMALDSAIYDGNNVEYNEEKCYLALFDELGELNHELKKIWCWWKKTQKEVDRQRVLEELVDCYHFGMSIYYHKYGDNLASANYETRLVERNAKTFTLNELYRAVINTSSKNFILSTLFILTYKLDFTMEDVYQEYKRKNQENYDRLARGY
jgi:dimeric dUTPase (all-alpha-NTP-PPase superfamily)